MIVIVVYSLKVIIIIIKLICITSRLAINRNGTYHLPLAQSPEYGDSEDTVYDLSLFRWGVKLMDDIIAMTGIHEPNQYHWHHVIDHLVEYPVDEDGLLVGATLKLTSMHRHWSHLFPIYPLHVCILDIAFILFLYSYASPCT